MEQKKWSGLSIYPWIIDLSHLISLLPAKSCAVLLPWDTDVYRRKLSCSNEVVHPVSTDEVCVDVLIIWLTSNSQCLRVNKSIVVCINDTSARRSHHEIKRSEPRADLFVFFLSQILKMLSFTAGICCLNVCLLKVPESFSSVTIRLSENPRPEETRVYIQAVTKNNILRSRTRSRWWRETGSLDGDRGLHGDWPGASQHVNKPHPLPQLLGNTYTQRQEETQSSRTDAQQEAVGSESCRTFMRWSQRDSTESAILTEEWIIWHQVWTSM